MKAVDILVAARHRLTNYNNWTTRQLVLTRYDGGKCFCALGATIAAGGGFTNKDELVLDEIRSEADFLTPEYAAMAVLSNAMFCATNDQKKEALTALNVVSRLLHEEGFEARATTRAIAYLQAAARIIDGTHVVNVNDKDRSYTNHKRVLAMFDLAIKNAKRRHINGKSYASQTNV